MAGSDHRTTFPRKMSASTGPLNLIAPGANALDVHRDDDAAEDDRKLGEAERGKLTRFEWHVRGGEVHRAILHAQHAAEGTDRFIGEGRIGWRVVEAGVGGRKSASSALVPVVAEPPGKDGIHEGRTRSPDAGAPENFLGRYRDDRREPHRPRSPAAIEASRGATPAKPPHRTSRDGARGPAATRSRDFGW